MTGTVPAAPHATIACPFCATLNRIDLARLADGPRCGECKRPILLDRPLKVTDAEFERVLTGTDVPVIVDFYADWCGPCKMMAPIFDELASEQAGKVLVLKLDTDANPATSTRLNVRGIPTLIAFRAAKETGRQVGVATKQKLEALLGGRP